MLNSQTDEELGKAYYIYTNRGWPNHTPWEKLQEASRYLFIQRAKKAKERYKNEDVLHQ
jgi:hypothetical protein